MVVIFWFSSRPVAKVSEIYWPDFFLKKTAHLIEYAILFILLFRASKNVKLSFLILVFYALSDELHQSFTNGRDASLRDVFIDSLGGYLGLWFQKNLLPKAPKKLKN